jgi:hypothetical protein
MDPQDPQAPLVDTPAQSAPEGTPDAPPQIDWEKRYNDLRPQYDRTNQELAKLNDEDYQKQLMAQWGYEVDEPEPVYEQQDPTAELRQQIAELSEWKNAQEQQRQQAEQLDQITSSVAEQFQSVAPDLDKQTNDPDPAVRESAARTREWITTRALNMNPREDGMPDIQGAVNEYNAWVSEQQQKWEQGRKRPRAPHVPPGGQAGTDAPNLDDREARRRHMAEQLAALEADS